MPLTDRWMGAELSVVERELACNKKYANVDYVIYNSKWGEYFFLHPSPFFPTPKNEIYHTSGSPPPEYQFVEVEVSDEKNKCLDKKREKWIKIREVSNWKPFDPTPLARRKKILDFREIM